MCAHVEAVRRSGHRFAVDGDEVLEVKLVREPYSEHDSGLDLTPIYSVEDVAVVYKEPHAPILFVEQGHQCEVEAEDRMLSIPTLPYPATSTSNSGPFEVSRIRRLPRRSSYSECKYSSNSTISGVSPSLRSW